MDWKALNTLATLNEWGQKRPEVVRFLKGLSGSIGRPRSFSVDIRDTGEKAYQRAIWLSGCSLFDGNEIAWLDLEVPVVPGGTARRQCADLIGWTKDRFVLVELKKDGGQHPLYAAAELFRYAAALQLNKANLQFHDEADERRRAAGARGLEEYDLKTALCIVAGPEKYWERHSSASVDLLDIQKAVEEAKGPTIHFAEFNNENFLEQLGDKERYRPQLMSTHPAKWRKRP